MVALISGRVAKCVERTSEKGKFYNTTIIQGEGTDRVDTVYVGSTEAIPVGAVKDLKVYVGVYNNRLNCFLQTK